VLLERPFNLHAWLSDVTAFLRSAASRRTCVV
jgi:hypothetical protein